MLNLTKTGTSPLRRHRLLLVVVFCLCSIPIGYAADEVPLLRQAQQALAKNDTNTAKIHLRNLLKKEPSKAEARALLGAIYYAERNYAGAAKELKIAIRLGTEDPNTLLLLANAYLQQGKQEAIIEQIKVPKGASNTYKARVLAVRAQALAMSGRLEEGLALLDEALETAPDSPEALSAMARLQFAHGEPERALELSTRAADLDAGLPQAWLIKAEVLRSMHRFPEALETYEKALEVSSDWPQALLGRATVKLYDGDLDAARKDIDRVLKLVPGAIPARYLNALLTYQEGDLERAASMLEDILLSVQEHLRSQLLLGTIRYRQDQLEQARDRLSLFVSRRPEHVNARQLLAATYMKLKQPDEAVDTLAPLVEAGEPPAEILALLGSAYFQTGDIERGASLLARAAEQAPDVAGIRTQLALTQLAEGDTAGAIAELEAAADLGLSQADFLLVMTYLRSEDYDKALAVATELAKKMPDNPAPQNLIGAALSAKGDNQGARDAFARALAIAPESSAARFNLARMQIIAGQREQAIANLDRVLASNPAHLSSATARAGLAAQDGDIERAEAILVAAYEGNRESIDAALALGRFYLETRRPADALRVARQASNLKADDVRVQRTLGLAYIGTGDKRGALQAVRKVVTALPDSVDDRFRLGLLQLDLGKISDAESNLALVYDQRPDDKRVMIALAIAKIGLKQYTEARELVQKLQQAFPDEEAGYRLAGDIAVAVGDPSDAVALYRTALDKAPSNHAYRRLFLLQRKLTKTADSLRTAEQWLAFDPALPMPSLILANDAERRGDKDAALVHYRRIIEQHPEHATALNNAAWILMTRGDAGAFDLAKRAYDAKPNEPNIVDTYAMVLLKNGEPEKALLLFRKLVDARPSNLDFAYHLALAEDANGWHERALRRVQKVLDSGTDFGERASAEAAHAAWKAAAER